MGQIKQDNPDDFHQSSTNELPDIVVLFCIEEDRLENLSNFQLYLIIDVPFESYDCFIAMFDKYIKKDCDSWIPLKPATQISITDQVEAISNRQVKLDIFDVAVLEILQILYEDFFLRFIEVDNFVPGAIPSRRQSHDIPQIPAVKKKGLVLV